MHESRQHRRQVIMLEQPRVLHGLANVLLVVPAFRKFTRHIQPHRGGVRTGPAHYSAGRKQVQRAKYALTCSPLKRSRSHSRAD